MTERRITPVDRAISAFGGIDPMARETENPKRRINRWREPAKHGGADGRIPAKHQPGILAAAKRLGLTLTADDLIGVADQAEAAS